MRFILKFIAIFLDKFVGLIVRFLSYEGIREGFPGRMSEDEWLKVNPSKTRQDWREETTRRQKEYIAQRRREQAARLERLQKENSSTGVDAN